MRTGRVLTYSIDGRYSLLPLQFYDAVGKRLKLERGVTQGQDPRSISKLNDIGRPMKPTASLQPKHRYCTYLYLGTSTTRSLFIKVLGRCVGN